MTVFDAGISAMTHRRRERRGPPRGDPPGRARPRRRRPPRRRARPRRARLLPSRPSARRPSRRAPSAPTGTSQSSRPSARFLFNRLLPAWDGGPVQIAGTVAGGRRDRRLPGGRAARARARPDRAVPRVGPPRARLRLLLHARSPDRRKGGRASRTRPSTRHRRARQSIRKLAELEPAIVWAGHADPVTGDVARTAERRRSRAVP